MCLYCITIVLCCSCCHSVAEVLVAVTSTTTGFMTGWWRSSPCSVSLRYLTSDTRVSNNAHTEECTCTLPWHAGIYMYMHVPPSRLFCGSSKGLRMHASVYVWSCHTLHDHSNSLCVYTLIMHGFSLNVAEYHHYLIKSCDVTTYTGMRNWENQTHSLG